MGPGDRRCRRAPRCRGRSAGLGRDSVRQPRAVYKLRRRHTRPHSYHAGVADGNDGPSTHKATHHHGRLHDDHAAVAYHNDDDTDDDTGSTDHDDRPNHRAGDHDRAGDDDYGDEVGV